MRNSTASALAIIIPLVGLTFGMTLANGQSSISIRGVNVPAESIAKAYEKAVTDYVYGDGLRQPVTETAYVKAWQTYREDQARREREKQDRRRAQQQQYRNNQQGGYNQQNRSRGSSTTIKAGSSDGISVRDKTEPRFIEVEAVVVRPGKDVIIMDEGGSYYKVESSGLLTATGRAQIFKLKEDPDRRTDTFRTAKGAVEVKIYQNYTLSQRDFLNFLRKGDLNAALPELRGVATSGFDRGSSGSPRGLGETRPAPRTTADAANSSTAAQEQTTQSSTAGTSFKRKSALDMVAGGKAGNAGSGTSFKRKSALDGIGDGNGNGSGAPTFKRKSALGGTNDDASSGGVPSFKRKSALGGSGDKPDGSTLQQRTDSDNFSSRTTTLKR